MTKTTSSMYTTIFFIRLNLAFDITLWKVIKVTVVNVQKIYMYKNIIKISVCDLVHETRRYRSKKKSEVQINYEVEEVGKPKKTKISVK